MNMLFSHLITLFKCLYLLDLPEKTLKTLFISFVAFLCCIVYIYPICNSIDCFYFVTDCLLVLNSH